MTLVPPAPAPSLTVRALLLPSQGEAIEDLTRVLASREVLAHLGHGLDRLSSSASQLAHQRLADAAAGLIDLRLTDVFAAGWQHYPALASAALRTLEHPGSQELVDLVDHHLTSGHRPQVEVLVNGVAVGSVEFELRLDAVVRSLVADVRDGRLTALHSGRCQLTITLAAYQVTLATREVHLDLPATLPLGAGLALVPVLGRMPAS